MNGNYIMFGIFLIFLAVFTIKRRKAEKRDAYAAHKFWNREQEANLAPVRDISHLNYIDFSGVSLPFSRFEDEKLKQCEEQILALKNQKILNLSGITNTELKLYYGAANLNRLMTYDQNFLLLVRTLHQWGQRLYELSCKKEAAEVLGYAVSIGSDIKATFELLLSVYQESGNLAEIDVLKQYASSLNTLRKDSILALLEKY